MSYKFLLFDLDHTLLDFALAEDVALELLLKEAGVTAIQAYKDYYVPMNKAMWEDLTAGKISKPELIRTRFSRLFAHFDQEVDGAAFAERYQHHLSQQGQFFDGVPNFLETLTQKGYRIFGATNGVTFIQKGRLAQSGLSPYFEQVFISDEVGLHKPQKEFYDYIARAVEGFDHSRALMIGDSLTADIQGGINAGIDTVWYNPAGIKNGSVIQPTYTIMDYSGFLKILEKC
ncbi:YjjG family noncanonical pyrimidine nucleotidase [Streptococcus ovis]|uniref:YjjG family noncanonical pyrimidine nucleotidase n=1 Tax=Streptococcus ovis TaxID=82806 RepID=UPI0003613F50|nr:YjjG family noncanonical pyrimidine nucleotidase [Streptococcus ovis]